MVNPMLGRRSLVSPKVWQPGCGLCGISIADSTATTDTHGSTSDTYGRWNIASQRGSWQLRTTRVRYPTDGRHDDVDTKRDDT